MNIHNRHQEIGEALKPIYARLLQMSYMGQMQKKRHGNSKLNVHVRELRKDLRKVEKVIAKWQRVALAPSRFLVKKSWREMEAEVKTLRRLVALRGLGADKRLRGADLLSNFAKQGFAELDAIRGASDSERPEPVPPQDRE